MKNIILRRFFPTFLCMALALILTSCDGKDQQPVESGTGSTVRTPSVSKEEGSSSERAVPLSKDKKDKSASNSESQKEDEPAPVVYSEAAQGSDVNKRQRWKLGMSRLLTPSLWMTPALP